MNSLAKLVLFKLATLCLGREIRPTYTSVPESHRVIHTLTLSFSYKSPCYEEVMLKKSFIVDVIFIKICTKEPNKGKCCIRRNTFKYYVINTHLFIYFEKSFNLFSLIIFNFQEQTEDKIS